MSPVPEAGVGGHQDRADPGDGEEEVDPLRAVVEPQADLVAGGDAERDEPPRRLVDPAREVREGLARRSECERFAVAPPCRRAGRKLPDRGPAVPALEVARRKCVRRRRTTLFDSAFHRSRSSRFVRSIGRRRAGKRDWGEVCKPRPARVPALRPPLRTRPPRPAPAVAAARVPALASRNDRATRDGRTFCYSPRPARTWMTRACPVPSSPPTATSSSPPTATSGRIDPKFRDRAPVMVHDEKRGDVFRIEGSEQRIPLSLVSAAGKAPEELTPLGARFEKAPPRRAGTPTHGSKRNRTRTGSPPSSSTLRSAWRSAISRILSSSRPAWRPTTGGWSSSASLTPTG